MNNPLVTIGIPTYNVGKFIAQSLKSVLAQTYNNFELIITDDGSTDNTVEEIRKFDDSRIILVVDGENHGISYRLNQQINMAKGDIFVRMDGDDLMFPTRVEEQVKFLSEHPEVEVVGSSIVVINDDNRLIGYRAYNTKGLSKQQLYMRTCFAHPSVCGRLSFFKTYYYDEAYNGTEDHNLWIRGFNGDNYASIEHPLMFYRDPCVFKLKTYLGRMNTLCRMFQFFAKKDRDNASLLRKLILISHTKMILSFTLAKLHLDSLMISRRNHVCISTEYQELLNRMVEKKTVKLKILNVSNIFFTLPYFFGNQLSHFTNKGYDISLVCCPDEKLKPFSEKHGCHWKEIFVPRVINPKQDFTCLWQLFWYMRGQKFDIVCGHTPVGGLLAICAAWLCGVKKRVFFRHGLVYETSTGLKRKLLIGAEKLASLLATHVVCVSPYLIERSVQDGLTPRNKMMLLGNGSCNGIDAVGVFNRERLDAKKMAEIRKQWNIPENAFVIGYTGRIVQDKGIEELVRAFKRISEKNEKVILLLVGMLEERDAITPETIKEIKMNPRIIHTGLLLGDMEYYYAMMDVLVLCTHREGLGSALLEAAAMGVPTLTTNHTGSRDAIIENVTGMFVTMNDEDSIIEKVSMYIDDEELRRKHGCQGREFVLKNFQQEIVWNDIEKKIYLS